MSTAPLNYSTESRGVLRRRVFLHRVLPAVLLVLLAVGGVWLTPKVWRHQQLLAMQDELRESSMPSEVKVASSAGQFGGRETTPWWHTSAELGNVAIVDTPDGERLINVAAIQQPPTLSFPESLLVMTRVAEPATLLKGPRALFNRTNMLSMPSEWTGTQLLTGSLEPVPGAPGRLQMDVLSVPATAKTITQADRMRIYLSINAGGTTSFDASRLDVVDVTLTIPAPGEVVPLPPLPQPKP
ncbi:MAG: hypothetical protein AAF561_14620 [Planctomycetota bacterium]